MAHPLKRETQTYKTLRERLLESFPEADSDAVRDTLEGITDLHEMIAAVIRSALVDEALQGGLRRRLEEMRERLARLEARGAKKRQLALEAMGEAGLKKLEQPDFTASARSGAPDLVIVSEETIPTDFWVPQPPKLDRQALLGSLKRGQVVPGVALSNPKPRSAKAQRLTPSSWSVAKASPPPGKSTSPRWRQTGFLFRQACGLHQQQLTDL